MILTVSLGSYTVTTIVWDTFLCLPFRALAQLFSLVCRERERREKERREHERREQERERERMIHHHQQQQQQAHLQAQHQHAQHQHQQHQQHLQAQAQAQHQAQAQAQAQHVAQHQARMAAESKGRDRSPIRNGGTPTEGDRKDFKDLKDEELAMLSRAGSVPPYYLPRLPGSLPMLDPSRRSLPPHPHPSAYAHPGGMWPGADPYRDAAAAAAFRYDPMRGLQYTPLMSAAQAAQAAMQEEERAKLYGQYRGAVGGPDPMAHLRAKDMAPSPPGPAGMLNNHQFHHRPSLPGLPPGLATGLPASGVPHPHSKMTTPTPPGGPQGPPGPGGQLVVDLHKKEEPASQPR